MFNISILRCIKKMEFDRNISVYHLFICNYCYFVVSLIFLFLFTCIISGTFLYNYMYIDLL